VAAFGRGGRLCRLSNTNKDASSIWIVNGHATPQAGLLPALLGVEPLPIGALIIGPLRIARAHAPLTADRDLTPMARRLVLTLILSDREAICM
jgi:hypothetical protein